MPEVVIAIGQRPHGVFLSSRRDLEQAGIGPAPNASYYGAGLASSGANSDA